MARDERVRREPPSIVVHRHAARASREERREDAGWRGGRDRSRHVTTARQTARWCGGRRAATPRHETRGRRRRRDSRGRRRRGAATRACACVGAVAVGCSGDI